MGKKIVETVVETTKTKKELPAEVKAAKDAYAAARIQLDLAIKANQNSMHAFRSFGSEENKKAYE
jgi:predicted RNase H-like HicB family nuclease